MTRLAALTTLRVGGPCTRLLRASTAEQLRTAACELWESGEEFLLLGQGSNTVVCDEGFPGTVLLVQNAGFQVIDSAESGSVRLRVQAGQNWDELVAACVAEGYVGLETLAGIPGTAGAAPVQNIGAYGQELAAVLHSIELLESDSYQTRRVSAAELALSYRDSALKRGDLDGVVLSIDLVLAPPGSPASALAYPQLVARLGANTQPSLQDVRLAVLELRTSKGMVLDEADHDTWSAGSFFTNPIVSARFARGLPAEAPRYAMAETTPQAAVTTLEELAQGHALRMPAPAAQPQIKLSAAWLIAAAGIAKGFSLPGSKARVSTKHTLALSNAGGATAAQVAELARFIQQRVQQEFGVVLQPEPNLYGLSL